MADQAARQLQYEYKAVNFNQKIDSKRILSIFFFFLEFQSCLASGCSFNRETSQG